MRSIKYSALHHIADEQHGMFTARQAIAAGFDAKNHAYYVRKGYWIKEHRGIYRLKHFPYEPAAECVLWSLWSCNRDGEPQGVYSHETAFSQYGLADLNPSKFHMTVPKDFRRRSMIPGVLVLYRDTLISSEWNMVEGYRVTTPVRTLRDAIFCKHITEEFLHQAVRQGLARGLYPRRELNRYGILDTVMSYR